MANTRLKSIKFPSLADTYTIPEDAEEFSPSRPYVKGEYVIQNGALYRFTDNHAAGAWNAAHVTVAKLGPDVADIANNMVHVSTETPTSDRTKIWVQGTATEEIVIPTMDDLAGVWFTADTYLAKMRSFFLMSGCNAMVDYTSICNNWYKAARTGWTGSTTFADPTQNSVSTGTKGGDNASMSCTPSTFTTHNTDDYEDNPLFFIRDCNWTLDEYGDPHITAIDGICGVFERSNTARPVGVLQATGWMKYTENADGSYTYTYTDEIGANGFHPLPEAVSLKDNSVRSWVVHGKYAFGDGYTCCAGQKTLCWSVSHNSQLTGIRSAWGNRYCGRTSADDAFLKLMLYIKYATLASDTVLHGCNNYNYTYQLAAAETGVERILLTAAQAATLEVGSCICVGTGSARSNTKATDTALLDRVKIINIETVEIDGTSYGAVYVDNGGTTFDTATTYYMYTYHWHTGSTDACLGNDGGQNPSSDKFPVRLQGIEYMVGCYEVNADVILQYETLDGVQVQRGYVCRDATKLSTSITANYTAASYGYGPLPAATGWTWPAKLGYDANLPELRLPSAIGGSSSTLVRDGYYIDKTGTTGLREWLSFGSLHHGLAYAGLSCLYGRNGLTYARWDIGGRLSPTGNRGEFQS